MSHSKRYPCRCLTRIKGVKCTGRRSLRMKPEEYSPGRIPPCPQCGKKNWTIDNWRIKHEMSGANVCYCSGMHFPHRKGSRFCFEHPMAEQDHSERYERAIA